MALIDAIQKISQENTNATVQARILYGVVKTVKPLSVVVDQRFTLLATNLIIPRSLTKLKLVADKKEYILQDPLKAGDKLIIINLNKIYLVLDRIGDISNERTITEK